MEKKSDILTGPIFKNLLLFTIPIILTGVLQLLYNAADVIVAGRFAGSNSLAAVGSTSSITNLLINLFVGLSVGTSVCAAQFIGGGESEKLKKTVHTSIAVALIGGIALMMIGFFLSRFLLELMQTPEDIIDEASLYMRIVFLGMPANLMYNFGAAILRAKGDTKTPLIFLSVSGMINVILNLVFVIVFKMKADGVGWATIISQYISAAAVVIFLMRAKGDERLEIRKVGIHKDILTRILKIGVPAGIQGMIFSISNVLIQSSVNSFGSVVVAGNSAASNIEGFTYTSENAVSQSVVTFVGQHVGAGKKEKIKKILAIGCLLVTLIGLTMGVLSLLFAHPILSLYAPGEEAVISSGINRLSVMLSSHFLCGIMEVIVGVTRGMGDSFKPMIVSVLGVCGVRIVWVYTVFALLKTPFSLYMSYPVSWLVTIAFQLVICIRTMKRLQTK